MITESTLKAVADAGFTAYMRKPDDTWLFFTDGVNIGYLQQGRGQFPSLSTVNVPDGVTGSGYYLGCPVDLSRGALMEAFAASPDWSRVPGKKWKSWAAFAASSPFNREYKAVEVFA